ncbi:MAG: TIGR00268 family protein [Desulfuromonas sp.]|nr:MAG: TIGR00268 family protein [Desulfuromonas sp.]
MTEPAGTVSLSEKYRLLQQRLQEPVRVAVAFSGGVDSSLLLRVSCDVLGHDNVLALTAVSPSFPAFEQEESRHFCRTLGVRQLTVSSDELDLPAFVQNSPRRCYHCKHQLFSRLLKRAAGEGFPLLLDGSNLDDCDDYRPGREALAELEISSPLLEAGFSKAEVRKLSYELGLPTWDKPPFACLASRFPYGTEITRERLHQVERCEEFLRQRDFRSYRVRYHNEIARIEVAAEEIDRLFDESLRSELVATCKAAGFSYIALDLEGYRSGSLNETLP